MAVRPLNSIAGYSVGEYPSTTVVDSNSNVYANNLTVTSTTNLGSVSNVTITGGTSGYYLQTNGSGGLTWAAVPSGNGIANGTSNVTIPTSGGNIIVYSGGNNTANITSTGINVSGTLNATGNANVGNLGTAQVLASANITAPQFISNVATGTAPLVVSSNTLVSNLNANLLNGAPTATANTASTIALRDNNGNLSANFFIGDGSQLTGLNTSIISNGNSNVNIPAANGNVNISAVGNANVVVITGTGVNVTGTLSTGSGNANVGNIGATNAILSNANASVGVNTPNVTGTTSLTLAALNGNVNLSATSGNVVVNGVNIKSVANPVQAQDAATKAYVDNLVSAGIEIHPAVKADADSNLSANYVDGGTTPTWTTITTNDTIATGSAHNLSVNDVIVFGSTTNGITGGIPYFVAEIPSPTSIKITATYDGSPITTLTNGTGLTITSLANSGVGATLTSTTNGPLTLETYTCALNDRVLILGQSNQTQNGVYYISQVGVAGGGGSPWILTRATDGDKYIPRSTSGLDNGAYFLVTAGSDAGEAYVCNTAGTIVFGTTNITFAEFSIPQVYTAGTGLTLAANLEFSISNTTVTAATYGNGDRVASFTVNSQGQLTAASNVAITANAANLTGTTLAATIVNSSLTSVGTLGTLNVSGNANVGNLGFGSGVIAGTGNITAGNFIGTFANGTSNVNIPAASGNVNISAAGSANVVVITSTGANITGTLNTGTGNASFGNVSATNGNLTTANISGNVILGNASVTTAISYASATTTAVTANQTIASFSVTGITGVEFLVKGIDSAGSKYSVSTVQAVTDGSSVDYSTYGGVTLGGYTGTFAVNVVGGQLRLQVTPASSNSTVWTTQYRFI